MQPVRRTHQEPMPRGCAVKFVLISRTFFLLADVFYPDDDNVNDPQVNPDVLAYLLESDDCHDPLDHIARALPILGMYQVRHLFHEIMPSLCWPDYNAPIADCYSIPRYTLVAGVRFSDNLPSNLCYKFQAQVTRNTVGWIVELGFNLSVPSPFSLKPSQHEL